MRIISGFYKGKKILEPNDIKTRPLKDLTKESIFNVIAHSNKIKISLQESKVLDLFSGVGSFGIECLSRGVEEVTFVEKYSGVLPVLKKNLLNLNKVNNYKIIEKDIYEDSFFESFIDKFDIIFLDPPYKDDLNIILEKINNVHLLNTDGIIILHRHKNQKDIFPKNFEVIENKKYGISKVIFINLLS